MPIEPEVLKKIGEVLESGLLNPDQVIVDQEGLFFSKGVCAFELLETLMAIEHATLDFSLGLQEFMAAEYERWTVRTIQNYWQPILDALQQQDQKE